MLEVLLNLCIAPILCTMMQLSNGDLHVERYVSNNYSNPGGTKRYECYIFSAGMVAQVPADGVSRRIEYRKCFEGR